VGKDDLIEQYLFLTTSHDGFGSITAAFTPTRVVCANTLNAALKNCSNAIKIRHTTNAKERLQQAHTLMGISNRLSADLDQIFNQWAKVKINDEEIQKLIRLAMVPNKEVLEKINKGQEDELSTHFVNICNNAFEYTLSAPSQQLATTEGTLFGFYNGITGYFQNVKQYKNKETKLKSILLGGVAQQRAQTAFDLCMDFMKSCLS
jgi:phage/plasmid-like protein (TIGR03299 family)